MFFFELLSTFAKSYIIDTWQGPKYASDVSHLQVSDSAKNTAADYVLKLHN